MERKSFLANPGLSVSYGLSAKNENCLPEMTPLGMARSGEFVYFIMLRRILS